MATQFIQCGSSARNTGTINCDYVPGLDFGFIVVPKGTLITKAEQSAMDVTIKAKLKLANKAKRWYVIQGFEDKAIKGSDSVTTNQSYGGSTFVRDGKVGAEYMMHKGMCTWEGLRSFHDKQGKYEFLRIDMTTNCIAGVRANVAGDLRGFSLDSFYIGKFEETTGAAKFAIKIEVLYSDLKEFENMAIVQFDNTQSVKSLFNGLTDLQVEVVSAMNAGGTTVVKVTTSCGFTDAGESYATDLTQAGAFVLTQTSNNTPITIAGVTYNPNTKEYTVNATLPAVGTFPIGATAILNLAPTAVLEALATPVLNVEGTGAILTRV